MPDYAYENFRRVVYGEDNATFVPVCKTCGRFVKADKFLHFTSKEFPGGIEPQEPNADCSRCGRTAMVFEGFL